MKKIYLFIISSFLAFNAIGQTQITSGHPVYTTSSGLSIGTTTSGTRLLILDSQDSHFNSGLGITRSTSSQSGYINMVGGAFNFNAPSGLPIKFRDGGTTNVTISGAGYFGIGIENPTSNLHIYSPGVSTGMRIESDFEKNSVISFRERTSGGAAQTKAGIFWSGINDNLTFDNYGGGHYIFRDFAGNNVGIGTDSPSEKLEVTGRIKSTSHHLEDAGPQTIVKSTNGVSGYRINVLDQTGGDLIRFQNTGTTQFILKHSGNVGIGTTSPNEKLEVNGTIRSKKVKVEASPWPDYVFESDYDLPSLAETEAFIKANKHLPEVPSAKEVEANGQDIGAVQTVLLKKIEEMTLLMIELNKTVEQQNKRIKSLESQIEKK